MVSALLTIQFLNNGVYENLHAPKIVDVDTFKNLKVRTGGNYASENLKIEFVNNTKIETRKIAGNWFKFTLNWSI